MRIISRIFHFILTVSLLAGFIISCINNKSKKEVMTKKDFNSDLEFLSKYMDPVLLSDRDSSSMLILAPQWQGRVMTSTAKGPGGYSFGWINYDHIRSGKYLKHMNPYGGENRLWLGPEGGQFSIYFPEGAPMEFAYWQVPDLLDTMAFPLVEKTAQRARFQKEAVLKNYAGFKFELNIEREVQLLDKTEVRQLLGLDFEPQADWVAYETRNILTNRGGEKWSRQTGTLSLWILDMLKPSDQTAIIIPLQSSEEPGKGINDAYFGSIPPERLKLSEDFLLMKADGKQRGKIGVSPRRAKNMAGSYDPLNKILNIIQFSRHEGAYDYVNSLWQIKDEPFRGDVVNAYNDGPLEDGSRLGPFYELESSSPASFLEPGERMVHVHRVFHFQGKEDELEALCRSVFGVPLEDINMDH